jgi:hypothetical protein
VYCSATTTPPGTPTQTNVTGITSTVISDLTRDTTYYVWVQAADAGGVSALSPMASKTLTLAAPTAPTLTAVRGMTSLTVSWSAVALAASYKVYCSTTTTPPGTPTQTNITETTSTVITGLTRNATDYVWVQAADAGGVSALSSRATKTLSLSIGDTGPGGGMVFYAQGGTYMECSGELGTSNWSTAISVAQNHRGGGYTNWHLPTKSELDLMYQSLKTRGLGGFSDDSYWSSTEYRITNTAWLQRFRDGYQDYDGKNWAKYVRAVRSF